MRRLTLALAAVAALVPATLGLIGNSSFAQTVPTRVPASAQVVTSSDDTPTGTPTPRLVVDDHRLVRADCAPSSKRARTSRSSASR